MTKQLVHRIPGDGNSLGPERGVELLDAERPAGVPEQLTNEPPEPNDVAYAVTFHHVAKHRHVNVVPQQLMPRRGFQSLGFRKPAGNQPRRELLLQVQALASRQHRCMLGKLRSLVAKGFFEPERVNEHLPSPSAQGRSDFARQQRG